MENTLISELSQDVGESTLKAIAIKYAPLVDGKVTKITKLHLLRITAGCVLVSDKHVCMRMNVDDTTTVKDFEVWYRGTVNPPEDPIND
jgi:hypothetical protein